MLCSLGELRGSARRIRDGADPYVSTKVALNRRMLAKPAANAMAVTGSMSSGNHTRRRAVVANKQPSEMLSSNPNCRAKILTWRSSRNPL